jgi:hypothetical protein
MVERTYLGNCRRASACVYVCCMVACMRAKCVSNRVLVCVCVCVCACVCVCVSVCVARVCDSRPWMGRSPSSHPPPPPYGFYSYRPDTTNGKGHAGLHTQRSADSMHSSSNRSAVYLSTDLHVVEREERRQALPGRRRHGLLLVFGRLEVAHGWL